MQIKDIAKEELEEIVKRNNTFAGILKELRYSLCNTAYKSLYKRLKSDKIEINHIPVGLGNRKGFSPSNSLSREEFIEKYLKINSSAKPNKKSLVKFKLLEYKCNGEECSISSQWLDKPITLQLDHINGINTDNRLDNLRFLCPNCHSQTETFSGRNISTLNRCVDCNKRITSTSVRCIKCSSAVVNSKRKKFEVSKEELKELLSVEGYTSIAKKFGVSDNAIKKRARKYGLVD